MNELKSNSEANKTISGLWTLKSSANFLINNHSKPTSESEIQERLMLDVDGTYPQMAASGTWKINNFYVHWFARLISESNNMWIGHIEKRDGDISLFPYTSIIIKLESTTPETLKLVFKDGSEFEHISYYTHKSNYFYQVKFEYDSEEGIDPITYFRTYSHPNHPQSLDDETISIETVYRRAGFDVNLSSETSPILRSEAGIDAHWSDSEMHDTMQKHWSDYSENAKWAMWVFYASLHEEGNSLGGIMFDDIGPQHRQGTAIFNKSFISNASETETHKEASVNRMKFWTACHEIGHGFNLAHSWQKSLGTQWLPLNNQLEARSFMNYPYNVNGREKEFFKSFEYRFSDDELIFLRHAPEQFIEMGNAKWFDNHGFNQDKVLSEPTFNFNIRINKETTRYEFLECVVIELKLTNNMNEPQIVDKNLLSDISNMTVVIKKQGEMATQILPYIHHIRNVSSKVLMPNESVYESLFISVGKDGWSISEPGNYLIQIALHLKDEDIISNQLTITVDPPIDRLDEILAQDFFSDEIARILYFDGSQYFKNGNDLLRTIIEKIPQRKVSTHARVALALPMIKQYKILGENRHIHIIPPKFEEARNILNPSLINESQVAANTLGNIDYRYYMEKLSNAIAFQHGNTNEAAMIEKKLYETLENRKVKENVLTEVKQNIDKYTSL